MASTLLLAQSALSLPRLPPISLPTRPPHLHTPLPPHLPRLATPPRAGPIIASADGSSWATFAILTCAAATGRRLGTVPVGRTLSGPICAMGLTFAGACSGVLPPVALNGVVRSTQINAVRLATPLLLFNADLRKVYRSAGRMLPAFLLGALASLAGALVGTSVVHAPLAAAFGADGLKVAAALAAKNIGGGLNFVAVAAALGVGPAAFAAALAVDNVMALVYFPLCSVLLQRSPPPPEEEEAADAADADAEDPNADCAIPLDSDTPGAALAVAAAIVAVSLKLAAPGYDVPLATLLTVAAATAAPRVVAPLAKAGEQLGAVALYVFFATAGWSGGAIAGPLLLGGGAALLVLLTILYAVHLAIVLGAGAPHFERPLLLAASNANIGGPATAAALVEGTPWKARLGPPALLVGNLGYAVATPLALVFYRAALALGLG